MFLMVYVYVKNITTLFKLWRSMKVTYCTTAILADVLLSRYMYFGIICWAIKLPKVGLDRIMVYTLYNNLS